MSPIADPAFPARVVELAEPRLPNSAWALLKVTVGGICGSDLEMYHHQVGYAFYLDNGHPALALGSWFYPAPAIATQLPAATPGLRGA